MKMMHISDLHLGKRLNGRSLKEDQKFILDQIVEVAIDEGVSAMLIAGDVFDDGSTPSAESVTLLDNFLTDLRDIGIQTYMVSGNHDNMDKLEFGSRMFRDSGLFISSTFKGYPERFEICENDRKIAIYLLPFIKPSNVRPYNDDVPSDYNSALEWVLKENPVGDEDISIMVTHQYVVSGSHYPETCDSESRYVGGEEAVNADLFDEYDYVALGHIHSPQCIGRETVRYCGAPLKYTGSVKETAKSVTILDIEDEVTVRTRDLKPLRDVRVIRGPLEELIRIGKTDPDNKDYIYATIEGESMNAMARMREVYENTMHLSFENSLDEEADLSTDIDLEHLDLVEEFSRFYELKAKEEISESQKKIIKDLFDRMEAIL